MDKLTIQLFESELDFLIECVSAVSKIKAYNPHTQPLITALKSVKNAEVDKRIEALKKQIQDLEKSK